MTRLDKLITVQQAVQLAASHGEDVPPVTVRWAARKGWIPNAQKLGRDWVFTDVDFVSWLRNRPKPGPKPSK